VIRSSDVSDVLRIDGQRHHAVSKPVADIGELRAFASSLTSDRWLAEDAVQETLLKVLRFGHTYRSDGDLSAWIRTICRNAMVDLVRRNRTHLSLDDRVENLDCSAVPEVSMGDIEDALAGLPPAQLDVVMLCCVYGYEYADVAEMLGVPIGTVRSRLSRGRLVLSSLLDSGAVDPDIAVPIAAS